MQEANDYPEKSCEIDRLVTHTRLVQAVLEGKKTQQRRGGVYGYPGEEFELEGVRFKITGLRQERLDEMGDEGARAEGYPSLEMYRNLILSMHPGMEWDGDALVWVHEFERA